MVEFEKLFLGDYDINHCKGCRACMEIDEHHCPWTDDIPIIKEKIKGADAVIFASPVYVGDVSSSMKALIDRMAYICHRQEFYDKCSVILATTNATSLKRTIHTMGGATYSWGFKTIGTKGFKTSSSYDSKVTLKNRYYKDIKKLAKKLYLAIQNQSYLSPSILSLAVFKIQQKARANPEIANPTDFKYWNKMGWTDPKKLYYIDVKPSSMRIFASKLLGRIITLFF